MRVFGCAAWAHVPEERRNKLNNRAICVVYVGIAHDTKAHKLFDPLTKLTLVT